MLAQLDLKEGQELIAKVADGGLNCGPGWTCLQADHVRLCGVRALASE